MQAQLRMGEHARGDDLLAPLSPSRQTTDTADVRPTLTAQRHASPGVVKAQAKARRKAKKEARKKQRR